MIIRMIIIMIIIIIRMVRMIIIMIIIIIRMVRIIIKRIPRRGSWPGRRLGRGAPGRRWGGRDRPSKNR